MAAKKAMRRGAGRFQRTFKTPLDALPQFEENSDAVKTIFGI